MKKYILSAAAFLLFAGFAGAQVASSQPAKTNYTTSKMATKPAVQTRQSTSPSKTVTAGNPAAKKEEGAMIIKRKHHHKTTKSPRKTESK